MEAGAEEGRPNGRGDKKCAGGGEKQNDQVPRCFQWVGDIAGIAEVAALEQSDNVVFRTTLSLRSSAATRADATENPLYSAETARNLFPLSPCAGWSGRRFPAGRG